MGVTLVNVEVCDEQSLLMQWALGWAQRWLEFYEKIPDKENWTYRTQIPTRRHAHAIHQVVPQEKLKFLTMLFNNEPEPVGEYTEVEKRQMMTIFGSWNHNYPTDGLVQTEVLHDHKRKLTDFDTNVQKKLGCRNKFLSAGINNLDVPMHSMFRNPVLSVAQLALWVRLQRRQV